MRARHGIGLGAIGLLALVGLVSGPREPVTPSSVRSSVTPTAAPTATPTAAQPPAGVPQGGFTAVTPHPRRHVVPSAPATKRHTGTTGHPCLPGERDGDHDGYCGEGR